MPLALSTSWLTVPDGLTQVIAALTGMPRRSAHTALVRIATLRSSSRVASSPAFLLVKSGLSIMPVKLTPNRRSSSVFLAQILRKYGNFVYVLWMVPRIVASSTLVLSVSTVSVARTTTSVRLQNWYGRRMISLHGFVPKS